MTLTLQEFIDQHGEGCHSVVSCIRMTPEPIGDRMGNLGACLIPVEITQHQFCVHLTQIIRTYARSRKVSPDQIVDELNTMVNTGDIVHMKDPT